MSFKLVGIGELLWDLLPGGRQMGGAPANFAYHSSALGAEARIVSRVGSDARGRELIEQLEKIGLRTDCIEVDPVGPTGTVSVKIAPDGQPQFTIHENVAWDGIVGEENAQRAVSEADAVCFGTLAQRVERSRASIHRLLALAPRNSLRILDVNLRQHFYSPELIRQSLEQANILKVNDEELPRIAEMFSISGDMRSQLVELAARFDLKLVACTRGGRGSLLLAGKRCSEHPGVPVKVADTIGAGDSFTAAMILGWLTGLELDEINRRANEVASFVASSVGAMPRFPAELRSRFQKEANFSTATTK